jgi:hypothetical protein
MRPIPVRRAVTFGITSICGWLAAVVHFQSVSYLASDLLWVAPSPPIASFPEGFLVMPGLLAGLPLVILGATLDQEWLTQTGLVLGAGFFWYCIGWQIDSTRGLVHDNETPRFVRWYLSALIVVSIILLPFDVLAGINLGVHSCANGVPPYWVELVSYGIVTFWITIGCYFGWLRFRDARKQRYSLISLK